MHHLYFLFRLFPSYTPRGIGYVFRIGYVLKIGYADSGLVMMIEDWLCRLQSKQNISRDWLCRLGIGYAIMIGYAIRIGYAD